MALISLRSWELWLYGLVSGVVGATAGGVGAVIGVPLAKAAGMDVKPLDWQQIKVVAAWSALTTLVAYLRQSPLPQKDAPEEKK